MNIAFNTLEEISIRLDVSLLKKNATKILKNILYFISFVKITTARVIRYVLSFCKVADSRIMMFYLFIFLICILGFFGGRVSNRLCEFLEIS